MRKSRLLAALLTLLPAVGLGQSKTSALDDEAVRKVIQQCLTKTDRGWLVAYYRAGDLRDLETAR